MACVPAFHLLLGVPKFPSLCSSNRVKLCRHPSKKASIKCSSQLQPSQPQLQQPTQEEEEGGGEDGENSLVQRRSGTPRKELRPSTELCESQPPNFEIGWSRTKKISTEKKRGYVIMDFLEKLEGLMAGGQYGSTDLLAKAGGIVAERVREEAEVLRERGEVEDRLVVELLRVLKLMEMEMAMVKAAKKEETLTERIEQARVRCRQAILVAESF